MRKQLLVIATSFICAFSQQAVPSQAGTQTNPPQNQRPQKADEQEETIKLSTTLIEARVVVTDKSGKFITDLNQADFELRENDQPQTISFFSLTQVPGKAEAVKNATNPAAALAAATAKPTRSIVLFADTTHIAPANLLFLKQMLRRFIDEQLGEQDMTALVTSFGTLGLGEQFTRDRRLLRYAVERLSLGPSDSEGFPRGATPAMAYHRSRTTQLTIRAVVDKLAQMPGQRLLVLFSDGFTLRDAGRFKDYSELQNITSRATRSGVMIYSIDSKGLQPPPGISAQNRAVPNLSFGLARSSEAVEGLEILAADTGGKFFSNTNDLLGAAKQVLADNQAYYTLAYYPAEEGDAKKFRKLALRIKGHPEYRIRTQKGYLPTAFAKQKTEAARTPDQRIAQAMTAPLVASELGVFATADDIESAGDPAQVTVQVFVDGHNLNYQPAGGRQQIELKIVLMVLDSAGKLVSDQAQTIQANLRPEVYETVRSRALNYFKRLALKPGFYQIRVGVYEPQTERIGTASALVQVPELKSKQLSLSSLLLADNLPGQQLALPRNDKDVANTPLPSSKVVQGIHFFQRNQRFLYYFCLYQNAAQAARPEELELQTQVWQGEKMLSEGEWLPVSARMLGRDAKGLTVGGQLQLSNFPAGLYELRVMVRGQQKKAVAQRAVVFGIEG
jgi:VWFA-related protein